MGHFKRVFLVHIFLSSVLLLGAATVNAASLFFDDTTARSLQNSYEQWLNPPPSPVIEEPTYEPPPPVVIPEDPVTLNGFIQFENERNSSVWLNGTKEKGLSSNRDRVRVKTPKGYKLLSPGQQFDPDSGKIIEPAAQTP